MSNQFLAMAQRALSRQGVTCTYVVTGTSTYDVNTGTAANTSVSTSIKAYPKHIIANQYNHPNLVGKSVKEFYIAGNAVTSVPKSTDKIIQNSDSYTIVSVQEHSAGGQVCLYCVLAVKQ